MQIIILYILLLAYFAHATVPSPCTSLALIQNSPTISSLQLTWTIPSNDGGYAITGYNVHYRKLGSTIFNMVNTFKPPYNLENMVSSSYYDFKVNAINVIGESSDSAITTLGPTLPLSNSPKVPISFNYTLAGDFNNSKIVLNWDDANSDSTGCIVEYKTESSIEWATITISSLSITTYTIENLVQGSAYDISMASYNLVGTGLRSSQTTELTWQLPAIPQQVLLKDSSLTSSSFSLQWITPIIPFKGAPITGYFTLINGNSSICATTSFDFINLQPSTEYSVSIYSINSIGQSINANSLLLYTSNQTTLQYPIYVVDSYKTVWRSDFANGDISIVHDYIITKDVGMSIFSYNPWPVTDIEATSDSVYVVNRGNYILQAPLNSDGANQHAADSNFLIVKNTFGYIKDIEIKANSANGESYVMDNGGVQGLNTGGSDNFISDMEFDPSTNLLFLTDGSASLKIVDIGSNVITPILTSYGILTAMALSFEYVFVASETNGIIRSFKDGSNAIVIYNNSYGFGYVKDLEVHIPTQKLVFFSITSGIDAITYAEALFSLDFDGSNLETLYSNSNGVIRGIAFRERYFFPQMPKALTLSASNIDNATVVLSWTASECLQNITNDGYIIRYRQSNSLNDYSSIKIVGNVLSYEFIDIAEGRKQFLFYDATISGYNYIGEGYPSKKLTIGPCIAGYYSITSGQPCFSCPIGTTSMIGSVTCSSTICEIGYYYTTPALGCLICPSGSYCALGATTATACAPGFYSTSGAGSCSTCSSPAASYFTSTICNPSTNTITTACPSPASGFYTSTVCTAGTSLSLGFATSTTACQNPANGQFVSSVCSSGSYSILGSQTVVQTCAVPSTGYTLSIPCMMGSFSTVGSNTVFVCAIGFFQSISNSITSCAPCPAFKSTTSIGSQHCDLCLVGYYKNPSGSSVLFECHICPLGASCNGISDPESLPFYIATSDIDVFIPCNPQEACNYHVRSSNTSRPGLNSSVDFCNVGYTDLTCSSCQDQFYRLNGECVACPTNGTVILVCIIFSGLLIFLTLLYILNTLGFLKLLARVYEKLDSLLITQSITLVQTLSSLEQIQLKWTLQVKQTLSSLSFMNLNIELVAPECAESINFVMKQTIMLVSPAVFLVLIISFYTAYKMLKKKKKMPTSEELTSVTLFFLNLIYFSAANTTLNLFNCSLSGVKYVLVKEPGITCSLTDSSYSKVFLLAVLCLIIYVIGIPLLFMSLLYFRRGAIKKDYQHNPNRKSIRRGSASFNNSSSNIQEEVEPSIRIALGSLYKHYGESFYFWKVIEILRKLAISASLIFISGNDPQLQSLSILIILIFSALMQTHFRPYILRSDKADIYNQMESFSLSITSLTLCIGLCMDLINGQIIALNLSYGRNFKTVNSLIDLYNYKLDFLTVIAFILFTVLMFTYLFRITRFGRNIDDDTPSIEMNLTGITLSNPLNILRRRSSIMQESSFGNKIMSPTEISAVLNLAQNDDNKSRRRNSSTLELQNPVNINNNDNELENGLGIKNNVNNSEVVSNIDNVEMLLNKNNDETSRSFLGKNKELEDKLKLIKEGEEQKKKEEVKKEGQNEDSKDAE